MEFLKDRDDWDYGMVTLHEQIKIFLEASAAADSQCTAYFHVEDNTALLKAIDAGEVKLGYAQTLGFIRATDYIARMLVDSHAQTDSRLFSFVSKLTSRFSNKGDFKEYYLDYATRILEVVNREFDKEPGLRGILQTFLFR